MIGGLALYLTMSVMRTAIFSAKFEYLDEMREFAGQAAQDAGLSVEQVYAVKLAVDEACTNIIEHAYGVEIGGDIECTCMADRTCIKIILRDHGKQFDPTLAPDPDLTLELENRPIGGLGVFLMKTLMDEIHYEALGESGNLLTMVKCRGKAK